MLPYLIDFLKCTKCGSEENQRICCKNLRKTSFENSPFQSFVDLILNSEDKIGKITNFVDLNSKEDLEGEIYEFIELIENNKNIDEFKNHKIFEIVFGTDIYEGYLICTNCENQTQIKEGILMCAE